MTDAYYELWVRYYDTFNDGEFEFESRAKDKRILEDIIASMGWGEQGEIRGGPPDYEETGYENLTYEEFQKQFIVSYGTAYERNSAHGRYLEQQEEKEKKLQAEREAIRALPGKKSKLP